MEDKINQLTAIINIQQDNINNMHYLDIKKTDKAYYAYCVVKEP